MPRTVTHPTHPDVAITDGSFHAGDPFPAYAWMRANAPAYFDERAGVWGISRHADVKAIARDPVTFSNAGGIRPDTGPMPMMIDMDDPAHGARRKLVSKGFTPRRVRESEARVRQVCDAILDDVCEAGTADLVTDVAAQLPLIMIADMLGVAPADRADLLRWSDDMVTSQSGSASDEVVVAAGAAFEAYDAYARRVIGERRAGARPAGGAADDLMSILVHAEVDGDQLDDEELVWESLLILVGGDETTRHVISQGVYELVRHPDQWEALRADPSGIPTAVEEMLRWVTPLKNMARTATADVELHGQTIGRGDKLLLLYPSANRDEAVFTDPERFDAARTPNDHVAFGFGTHFCLGASLARLEIAVMLERLLTRLPDLTPGDDDPPPLRPANFVSGPERLPVRFTPGAPVGAGPV